MHGPADAREAISPRELALTHPRPPRTPAIDVEPCLGGRDDVL